MKFHILDHTGHTTVEFKPSETKEAMEKFAELIDEGKRAGSRKEGQEDYTLTKSFDPTADEHVFIRPMQGG